MKNSTPTPFCGQRTGPGYRTNGAYMPYLPADPATALSIAVSVLKAEERRRGVWAPLDPRQAVQIDRIIGADRHGQLTRADITGRLHEIARSMG